MADPTTDAPPELVGQAAVDGLVRLLDLERIEQDIFRGVSPKDRWQRVFGGQVAGQALVAAGRTVDPDRHVHSLHGYFIRPGDPRVPIVYEVDRVRDGRSFSTRRVIAVQHGKAIFTLSASFQLVQDGIDHDTERPDAPPPDALPTFADRLRSSEWAGEFYRTRPRPIDVRYVDPPPWERADAGPRDGLFRVWMRADGELPDDPLLHVCVLTFASDMTLLDSVLARQGLANLIDGRISMASLDHAMWFERPFRADDWLLYSMHSPSASGGRGLASGRFYDSSGRQVVSVVQEGMIRVRG
ncbi:acyl-CoA thioesterase II [Jatrophihabitans endophyticus]|uniref:acyl-CoA thioesterase n=1 Tax=Jatrophihabitans endophyticus TaxID=1206085 RepID=UPI0019EC3DFE|nr:acyl-CoA thioesterase II [Jatrophihabitans endophyticus]MBE7187368.1 acyl-CoA thioesterase II [Jatrophihabitans endophyticus]